jgi:hypothetical protein
MKEKEPITVYGCPFCDATVRGPPNSPKLGPANLQTHVKCKHSEKYDEFMKTPIENYEIEVEEPAVEAQTVTKTEPPPPTEFKQLQKPQVFQKMEVPIEPILPPDEWIAEFLKAQASVKDKFVNFQRQNVKLNGKLPEPYDLEVDLKRMDSGVKNETEAFYIRRFYEAALDEYLYKVEVDRNYGSRGGGIRVERQQQPQSYDYHRGGIPIRREYEPFPEVRQQSYRGGPPQSFIEEELMRLREDARRRDEEDRRRKEQEVTELKAQLAQLTMQLQTGGGGNPRLEQKLEQMETDRRRMEEQYAQLKENTLLDRIRQIEAVARSGPSSDEIKSWLKDTVNEYRAQLMVEKNLEELVEKKLQMHGRMGPTQTEVELEKARNDLVLGQKKLDIEEKKASQWGDTLKNVAGVFGEGIGKGMSGGKQQPAQAGQPQQPVTTCPHCRTPLILPPNVRYGMCPSCNGKIEVDDNGIPQKYMEPPPPLPPPVEQELPPLPPENPPVAEPRQRYKHRKAEPSTVGDNPQ